MRNEVNRRISGFAVLACAFAVVAGCGSDDSSPDDASTLGSSTTATSSSTSATSTSETTATSSEEAGTTAPVNDAPASTAVVAEPTLVQCIYGGGAWTASGLMSDGTYQIHPECAALREQQMAEFPHRCPRTDHYVRDLSECGAPVELPAPTSAVTEPTVPSETVDAPVPTPESGVESGTGGEPAPNETAGEEPAAVP